MVSTAKVILGLGILFLTCTSFIHKVRRDKRAHLVCNYWSDVAFNIMDENVPRLQELKAMHAAHPDRAELVMAIGESIKVIQNTANPVDHGAGSDDPDTSNTTLNAAASPDAAKLPSGTLIAPDRPREPPPEPESILDVALPPELERHYNGTLLDTSFWKSCQRKRNDVNYRWKSEIGWSKYDSYDISGCRTKTPECGLFMMPQVNQSHETARNLYTKCCVEHGKLREVTEDFIKVAKAKKLNFWFGMGTLLGVHRHNGVMIGWDSNVDLYIALDDEDALTAAFEDSKGLGRYMAKDHSAKHRPMYRLYHTPHPPSEDPSKGDSHVEIWLWKFKKAENRQIIFPLEECKFYDTTGSCPHNTPKLLGKHYPMGWTRYDIAAGGKHTLNLSIM